MSIIVLSKTIIVSPQTFYYFKEIIMEKKLKLFDLVSLGVGSVIGAGIFSTLGAGIALTGRSVALALVFGMLFSSLQQLRILFMSSMFSLKGGDYAQQALILPPIFTGASAAMFLVRNVMFSIFGISITQYLVQLIPALAPYTKLVGIIVLLLFFFVAGKGAGALAAVQNVMTIMMYIALGVLVVFGVFKVQAGGFAGEPYFYNGASSFLTAIAICSFACNGASTIVNMSDISENPKKNIPFAFALITVICAAIYYLLGYVSAGVLPYAEVAGKSLGVTAQQVLPAPLYVFFIVGGAMGALTTTLLAGIAAIPAPISAAAEDGWLPAIFKKKINVTIAMCIISVVPIIFDVSITAIVAFLTVPGMIITAYTNFKAISIPKKFPEEWENCSLKMPYPVYVLLMVASIVASLFTAVYSLRSLSTTAMIGNIVFTVVLFVYAWIRIKSGKVNILNATAD